MEGHGHDTGEGQPLILLLPTQIPRCSWQGRREHATLLTPDLLVFRVLAGSTTRSMSRSHISSFSSESCHPMLTEAQASSNKSKQATSQLPAASVSAPSHELLRSVVYDVATVFLPRPLSCCMKSLFV